MPGETRVVARTAPSALVILGQPVAQSLSPVFQNEALTAARFDVRYDRRDVSASELRSVLDECRVANCGGNVTMPHKHAVFDLAAHRTPVALQAGAVNTFWWEDGQLVGHNTDVDGVFATIIALRPQGIDGDVVVLGAGGSAAAVLVALARAPRAPQSRTIVLARSAERAVALAQRTAPGATVVRDSQSIEWTRVALVINTTPMGMRPDDPLPLDLRVLRPDTAVFDLVYKREGTQWVRDARARGHAAEDGLRMLVEQGASAFETWFGIPAPRDAMWRALGVATPPREAARL